MSYRILVVDDEPSVRDLLRMVLEEAGYEVLMAGNGLQALQAARDASIDLLITDLVMPDNEGIELIRDFRKHWPAIKVIAISGAAHGQYLRIANAFGADAIFVKPFDIPKLLATIVKLVGDAR